MRLFLKKRTPGGYMNDTDKIKITAGNRHIRTLFRCRRALGVAAVIHTAPMAILYVCIAMLSCHVLLA
jgi:hypothetical protein